LTRLKEKQADPAPQIMRYWLRISVGASLLAVLLVIAVAISWRQYGRHQHPWGSSSSQLDPSGLSYNLVQDRRVIECRGAAAGRAAIIVTLGQSLLTNSGDRRAIYTPGSDVYNFNLLDRKCYVAKDPLLGTTSPGSNQATRLADLLVRRQLYDRVILVPLAYGGTWISQWAPGGNMHPRTMAGLRYARDAGLEPTMILWQQGESEAANPPQPANGSAWSTTFASIAKSIRDNEFRAPIYVAKSTVCGTAPNAPIRSAQESVVNGRDILAGPDTDLISVQHRRDGCHLGQAGLDEAARLWFAMITSRPD
jgi:hypothetical protein